FQSTKCQSSSEPSHSCSRLATTCRCSRSSSSRGQVSDHCSRSSWPWPSLPRFWPPSRYGLSRSRSRSENVLNRLREMLIKELIQLFRDPRARFGLLVPSILQVLIYGYAATFELHHVRMGVLDFDHSYESRELLSRFESNGHFELAATLHSRHQISDQIDHGKVTLAVQILPGFAELLRKGQTAPVQVILDGTDSNTA